MIIFMGSKKSCRFAICRQDCNLCEVILSKSADDQKQFFLRNAQRHDGNERLFPCQISILKSLAASAEELLMIKSQDFSITGSEGVFWFSSLFSQASR